MRATALRPCLLIVLTLASLLRSQPTRADITINEYVSANLYGLEDEDGDREDWIELYNSGPAPVDLTGFGLSDDERELFKWRLPRAVLEPGRFLLLFASGKDRTIWGGHWETVIGRGDWWRYRLGDAEPPSDWRSLEFDDSAWSEGPTGIGYSDGDDATEIPQTISCYLRKTFTIEQLPNLTDLLLHVDHDDGFVAYLNDVEIARAYVGDPGDHPAHDQTAYRAHEAWMYLGLTLPTEAEEVAEQVLRPGSNVLAVQVHNEADLADMSMTPFLTLGMVESPSPPAGVAPQLGIRVSHADFKLDPEGEVLTLCDRQGRIVDRLFTGSLPRDISRGRQPDGGDSWLLFDEPTPGAPNHGAGQSGLAADASVVPPAGFHAKPIRVMLSSPSPAATLYFTLDGSEPTPSARRYGAPIRLDSTCVVRARAFEPGLLPGAIVTRTYLIGETIALPTISLTTDPPNLWDEETGIHVMGPNANPEYPHYGANFWKSWERPIHAEYFAADGKPGFSLEAGVKINGKSSRTKPQKSLRIIARSGYGTPWIVYALFRHLDHGGFKRIVLRNSGNDWNRYHLRDGFAHRLAIGTGLDRQAYEPAVVFLNGDYWGVLNIRERQDRYYLQTHHGVDPDDVDILEDKQVVVEGDAEHYNELLEFVAAHDMRDAAALRWVQSRMDTDNFADYNILEIFLANRDWLGNNIKYWRPRTPLGKWRWLLFDCDWILGATEGHAHNSLEAATTITDPDRAWATFLLRRLLQNEEFRRTFINRYADHMNATLRSTHMHAVLREIRSTLEPEMPRHFERWGRTMEQWYELLEILEAFIDERPAHARAHLMQRFDLPGTFRLSIDIRPPGAGRVELDAIRVDSDWSGEYFLGVPIRLTAAPRAGFAFARWSNPDLPDEDSIVLTPDRDHAVTVLFEPEASINAEPIVINEINYRSATDFDAGGWIELYNPQNEAVNLSGWGFRRESDERLSPLPIGTVIPANGFLVVCENDSAFGARLPHVPHLADIDMGLAEGGRLVRLYDKGGWLVDWLEYATSIYWGPEANGGGATLELIDPVRDNTHPDNWAASVVDHGTPGAVNSVYGGSLAPFLVITEAAAPNPFHRGTGVTFGLSRAAEVDLRIFNAMGRQLRTVASDAFTTGRHVVWWDGRDEEGRPLPSSIYFYRLTVGSQSFSGKLTLVR